VWRQLERGLHPVQHGRHVHGDMGQDGGKRAPGQEIARRDDRVPDHHPSQRRPLELGVSEVVASQFTWTSWTRTWRLAPSRTTVRRTMRLAVGIHAHGGLAIGVYPEGGGVPAGGGGTPGGGGGGGAGEEVYAGCEPRGTGT
jgi:hypothetical protein